MMFFWRKDGDATAFSKHYKAILNITKSVAWISNAEFELLPAMFVLCDYAAASANRNREAVADSILAEIRRLYPKFDSSVFDRRVNLYGEVIRGSKKLRGEFALGNTTEWYRHPIMKISAVWGDITVNPSCAENYSSAPMMLRGIDEIMIFYTQTMKSVVYEMNELFSEIHKM